MTIDLLILFDSDSVSLYISGRNEMKLLDVLGTGMSNLQKQVKYSSVPIILYFHPAREIYLLQGAIHITNPRTHMNK